MKLLLDVGNSRIKWAALANGSLQGADQIVHRSEPEASVADFLDRCPLKPQQVLVANVAGSGFKEAIAAGVESRWNLPVEFALAQRASGSVRNGYQDYRQLGVDRWLGILAAADRYRKAVCIVDAGTAVTIDQVDGHGQHLGGIIVPGLDLMWRALTGNAADLERWSGPGGRSERNEAVLFGRCTDEAIIGGTMSAIRGLIEQSMQSALERYDDPVLVLTGGDAERIIPHIRMPAEHRPMLVLEGLALYVPD
jgi:type III pantothenate kinase